MIPDLAKQVIVSGEKALNIWSAGCASGEEPYTLAIIWRLSLQQQFPELNLHIVASDADTVMCQRAEQACYSFSSIKNLPVEWREQIFVKTDERYRLKPEYRSYCVFEVGDVRESMPAGMFNLVLCRNLVFTYFEEALQRDILEHIKSVICPGGALVLGIHESLPQDVSGLMPWHETLRIYRKQTE